MEASASDPKERMITTRTIARRAGVSSATVSLALRGHPRISAETRLHVQRVAAELGYRPDPQMARLMHVLRCRQPAGFQSTVAALTTIPERDELPYLSEMIAGIKGRAHMLGYAFTCLRLPDEARNRRALQRTLRSRGIEGLLLLPMGTPRSLKELLDWDAFSVVATTYSVLAPDFDRVIPNQFGDMMLLCERLKKLGCRRLGLVLPVRHDLTVHHGFSGGLAWQNMFGGTEPVEPLIYDTPCPVEVRNWFERERPDVIIARGVEDCRYITERTGLRIPGPVAFAVTSRDEFTGMAGIEERSAEIGKTAMDLLHTKFATGETGIPAVPKTIMIPGHWRPDSSLGIRKSIHA